MMYNHLEDGTHRLTITGPELAELAELVASLQELGGDASAISIRLFYVLGFQKIYEDCQRQGSKKSCFENVYKRIADGSFQLVFSDSEYYGILTSLISLAELGAEAVFIGRKLSNALGLQQAFDGFMKSPEGRDIFMRSSPKEGHA